MSYVFNAVYVGFLLLLSPWLVYKSLTTGKYRRGLWMKLTGRIPLVTHDSDSTLWFHGVSVGEIHLLRNVLAAFRTRHPECQCVVSTTTDTGFDEARKAFPDLPVFFWPLDFSWAVKTALRRVKPDLVVLAECELWPNFLRAAERAGVPVAVINGRMSPRSAKRFHRVRWFAQGLFRRLALCAVQTEEYARLIRSLGAGNVVVTGSVKYDGACTNRDNPGTQTIRSLFGVGDGELVLVAGSTQEPEEAMILRAFSAARERHPNLRLFLVPRQKDRFDQVAYLIHKSGLPFARRSELTPGSVACRAPVILVDTIGELGAVWGLADVAFVGGSLDGKRGGQNMIEPAAYGAAVLFGPHTWNFKETVARLLDNDAAIEVRDETELQMHILRLLADPLLRRTLGLAAQDFVLSQQGALERTLDALDGLLIEARPLPQAA